MVRDIASHNSLLNALNSVEERFIKKNTLSYKRWHKAKESMPGGNTRTVLHYDPFPITIKKGEGTLLESLDNDYYLDFLGEYSAGLYGHSNPYITKALIEAVQSGLSFGAPNEWEALLAEEICSRVKSIDKVRFTNSGTEANLMAIGAARAFTDRKKIMVFEGSYHGGVLYFKSNTSPVNVPYEIIKAPFNNTDETVKLIRTNADDLSAVLIEPMLGSGGCIPARKEFLQAIRNETNANDICLIFDEVMTSRSSVGGLQEKLDINPDITTLGKYLGGGASFGAFGGRNEIMELWNPTHPHGLSHAGTFNNNTMSMAAGYTGLTKVFTREIANKLFDFGELFKSSINQICKQYSVKVQITGVGSILGLHVKKGNISTPPKYSDFELNKLKLIHLEMSLKGFLFAQRGYLTLNVAMVQEDLNKFLEAFESVLKEHKDILA